MIFFDITDLLFVKLQHLSVLKNPTKIVSSIAVKAYCKAGPFQVVSDALLSSKTYQYNLSYILLKVECLLKIKIIVGGSTSQSLQMVSE